METKDFGGCVVSGDSEAVLGKINQTDPVENAENCRKIMQKICDYDLLSGQVSNDIAEQVGLLNAMRDYFLSLCVKNKKGEG